MFEKMKGRKDYKAGVAHVVPVDESTIKVSSPYIDSQQAKYMVFNHAQEIKLFLDPTRELEKRSETLCVEFAEKTKNFVAEIDNNASGKLTEQEMYYIKKQKFDDYKRLVDIATELSEIDAAINTCFELYKSTCEKEWSKRKAKCLKYIRGIHMQQAVDKEVVFDFPIELTITKFTSFVDTDKARRKIISINFEEGYLS